MFRFRQTLLVAAFLFLPLSINAEVKEHILDNGLKIIVSEDHKVPIATFQIWYRVGSRDELSGKTGLSHLLEHMMFKGTPKYGSKAFSRIVQRNGGTDNAHTAKDHTMYFQTMSSDRIGISIDLEADRMTNLILDQNEAISERDVVKEERRLRYEDTPQTSLYESFVATALMAHPYRNPVIGWMSDISSILKEDLFNHYKKYYSPDNAFIVVAGDVAADEIVKKIRASFGNIKKGGLQSTQVTKEPEQNGEKRFYLKKEAELPYILIGYHTPSFPHEDSFALDVLSTVLSGGKSSILYKSLVYEKKAALDIGAEYDGMYIDPFLFIIGGTAAPGRGIADVEKIIYAELEALKKTPLPEKAIRKAKNQTEASFIFGQDSLYMQAMRLGMFETLGGWKLMDKYLEGIKKVTPEDVQRVAGKYLTEDNRTVGILVPEKKSK